MKRVLTVAAVTAAAAVALMGCTVEAAEKETADSASRAKAPAVDDDAADPEIEDRTEETSSDIAKLGASDWYTYEDGLQAQVTKAAPYTIGEYAAGGQPGGQGVVVTVTLKNGTGGAFDADLTQVSVSSGPNGDEAERVYDSGTVSADGHSGSIAPGRSKTARYAYAVPASHLDDLMIEVAPSWEHAPAFFEGAAKK